MALYCSRRVRLKRLARSVQGSKCKGFPYLMGQGTQSKAVSGGFVLHVAGQSPQSSHVILKNLCFGRSVMQKEAGMKYMCSLSKLRKAYPPHSVFTASILVADWMFIAQPISHIVTIGVVFLSREAIFEGTKRQFQRRHSSGPTLLVCF